MKAMVKIVGILVLLGPGSAFSQAASSFCTGSDSWIDCVDKLLASHEGKRELVKQEKRSEAEAVAEVKVKNDVVNRNTGDSNVVSGLTTTVTEDFLSRLVVALVPNGEGNADGDKDQAPVFEITDFLGLDTADGYKAQVRLGNGELYAPLDKLLRESNLAAQADTLSDEVGDFDNISVGLSYSPTGSFFGRSQWGRNPAIYGELAESLIEKVTNDFEAEEIETFDLQFRVGKLVQGISAIEGDDDRPLVEIFPDETQRFAFISTLTEAVKANQDFYQLFEKAIDDSGVYLLSNLIDNQPQLNISLNGTINDELAGPDDISLKLTYEYGIYNVNRLLRKCSREDDAFAGCFRSFAQKNANAIKTGNRLAVSLEYQRTHRYSFVLPENDLSLVSDKSKSLIFGLSWGRYLGNTKDGKTRFELQAAYEDVSGDPARQGRGVATATFSHTLAKGVSTAVSLVYANKPEYRGDVDTELSARLGLSYKLGSVN